MYFNASTTPMILKEVALAYAFALKIAGLGGET